MKKQTLPKLPEHRANLTVRTSFIDTTDLGAILVSKNAWDYQQHFLADPKPFRWWGHLWTVRKPFHCKVVFYFDRELPVLSGGHVATKQEIEDATWPKRS